MDRVFVPFPRFSCQPTLEFYRFVSAYYLEQDILDRADQDVLQTLTPLARATILGFLERTRPLDHADELGKPHDHCNGGGV